MHPVEAILTPLGKAFRNRHADETASIANAPQLATAQRIALTSPSFGDGEEIPAEHCGVFIGDNVSPALAWGALPAGTVDLVLLMEDLDSPGTTPRIHAVAAFAPDEAASATAGSATAGLPEGALAPDVPGVRLLSGRRGPKPYAGPRPLPGHGPHHYRFHLYALDQRIDLAAVTSAAGLPAALDGHVLASGMLTGTRTS